MKAAGIEFEANLKPKSLMQQMDGSLNVSFHPKEGDEFGEEYFNVRLFLGPWPTRCPPFMEREGLLNAKGYCPVDIQTNKVLAEGYDDVYCIGDACWAFMEKPGKPHPKAGYFASLMGIAVSDLIGSIVRGGDLVLPTERIGLCIAESGFDKGIIVNPDLSGPVTGTGGPKMKFTPTDDGSAQKVKWLNQVLSDFFIDTTFVPIG